MATNNSLLSSTNNGGISISEWIANAIADTGCTVVYGGHGGAIVPLVNAVCQHEQLTWVCARNEHDAATMAAAHAKLTGGLGVVLSSSGPGATNLTTGLLEATLDRVAVLAITGLKPTAVLGYSEFQDVNQSRLFAGAGVEFAKDAASADAVIPLLRDAVATALTRRTCAHLAIPVDFQAAPSPLPAKHFCASHANLRLNHSHSRCIDPESMDAAAQTIVGSADDTRPPRNIIAVGLGAVYSNVSSGGTVMSHGTMSATILDLAEALNAPVLTRLHAKGVVDESHPLCFGVIGVHGKPGLEAAAALISTSDRVISIGVDDESLLLCNSAGLQIRKLIEIQADAIAVGTRFNAEHTLVGDIGDICRALTERVEVLVVKVNKKRAIRMERNELSACTGSEKERGLSLELFAYMAHNNPTALVRGSSHEVVIPQLEAMGPTRALEQTDRLWEAMHRGSWNDVVQHDWHRFYFVGDDAHEYCHPSVVLRALSECRRNPDTDSVSREACLAVDVGDVTLWASLCLNLTAGSRTLYSERLGTMGYALNAAIAGVLGREAPAGAVVLTGDGGFQMTLQELATFQQMKRPGDKLLCIVFDNRVLGRVAFGFENALGCDMLGPDFVALAKAYGGDGIRLDDSAKASEVIKNALKAEGLFLVHVIVDRSVKADMASFKDNALAVMNSG